MWGDIPSPFLEAAFAAARRGVTVRILLDGSWASVEADSGTNDDVLERINRRATDQRLPLEVRLLEPRGSIERLHNKGAVVDGRAVLVSSMNWALGSATENREVGLILDDPVLARTFEISFDADWDGRPTSGVDAWRLEDPRSGGRRAVLRDRRVDRCDRRGEVPLLGKCPGRVYARGDRTHLAPRRRVLPIPRGDARDRGGEAPLRTGDLGLRDGGRRDRDRGGLLQQRREPESRGRLRGARPPVADRRLVLSVSVDRLAPDRADDPRPLCRSGRPRLHRLDRGEAEAVCVEETRPLGAAGSRRGGGLSIHHGRVRPPREALVLRHQNLRALRGRVEVDEDGL